MLARMLALLSGTWQTNVIIVVVGLSVCLQSVRPRSGGVNVDPAKCPLAQVIHS